MLIKKIWLMCDKAVSEKIMQVLDKKKAEEYYSSALLFIDFCTSCR